MFKSLLLALLITLANCTVYNIANVAQLNSLLTNTTNTFANGDVINLASGTYPTAGFVLPNVSLTVQSPTGGFATMLSNASSSGCLIGWTSTGALTLNNLVFNGCKVYLSNGNSTITNCNFTNVNQSAAAVTISGGRSTMSNVAWDCNAGTSAIPADLEVTANGVAVDQDTTPSTGIQYSCSSGSTISVGGAAVACPTTAPAGTPSCSRNPPASLSPSPAPQASGVPQPAAGTTTGGIIVNPGTPAPQGSPQSAAPQGVPQPSATPTPTVIIPINPGSPAPQGVSPQAAVPQGAPQPSATPTPTVITPANNNSGPFYCYTGLNTEGSQFNLPTVQCTGQNPQCSMIYYSQTFPRSRAYDCSTQQACNQNSGNSNACCCDTSQCNNQGYSCSGNPASALAVSASLLLAVVVMALLY